MADALAASLEILQPTVTGSDQKQALIAARCMGLMTGYHARWKDAPFRITDVEAVVQSDLYNPSTGKKSRSFRAGGKIDVHALDFAKRKVIFDHKTTSEDISDPNGSYWRQLVVEGQASHYMLLEWLNERKVDYAIWDAVRKPQTSPKELSKATVKEILSSGTYYGYELTDAEKDEVEETGRESVTLYARRLAYDCVTDRPDRFFQRRQVPRLDAEIKEYADEFWGHSQDILLARKTNRWPRNSGACMLYGRPCKYLGICSGHDEIDSERWTRAPWVHPELPILDNGTGKDLLTNSRIRCFQTCRRKAYYQYELGITKVDEEEQESLYFGTLFHQALEQYFLELKKQQEQI